MAAVIVCNTHSRPDVGRGDDAPRAVSETGAARGLGLGHRQSASQSNKGDLFPLGSFGHTGFTGTSLWIDPSSETFVVFLSNRVHPDGKGDVVPLRGRVASIVAGAITDTTAAKARAQSANAAAELLASRRAAEHARGRSTSRRPPTRKCSPESMCSSATASSNLPECVSVW